MIERTCCKKSMRHKTGLRGWAWPSSTISIKIIYITFAYTTGWTRPTSAAMIERIVRPYTSAPIAILPSSSKGDENSGTTKS